MTRPPAKLASKNKDLDKVRAEVDDAVRHRSEDWRQLQSRILARVREYQKMGTLRSAIYNIYSREDRQPPEVAHRHLKASSKIALEVFLNRFGGTKQRAGQPKKIEPQPKFTIYDVSDVLGITIVCPFDADVDNVSEQIKADCQAGHFLPVGAVKRHDRRDYQAVHISLGVDEKNLRELQCEVQIKTAVQDAFSWKTHALAYKPDEDADPWFIEQFIRISVLLRTADGISDQLRGRLEEGRSINVKKRQAVRTSLLLVFRDHIARIGNEEKRKDLRKTFDLLRKHLASTTAKRGGPLLDIGEQAERAFMKYDYDANTFRLAVLCAMAPGDDGYLSRVDRHFHTWIVEKDPPDKKQLRAKFAEWTSGGNLLAIAHFCLNDIPGAIEIAETAVRRVGGAKTMEIGQLYINLAYYYAEQMMNPAKAREYAKKARAIMAKDLDPSDLDSLGFVQIATAANIGDVEKGLAECRAAFEQLSKADADDKLSELAKVIFEMHRELAYKRLSQMVSN